MSQYGASPLPQKITHCVHPSRIMAKLRAGKIVNSIKLNLGEPRVAEIAAMAGFDCVWLDMEHVPNTISTIEAQLKSIQLHGADCMVRVQRGGYSQLIQAYEAGADGIMVPHVMSLDDAKAIVRNTKFHPVGRRPLDGGNGDGHYALVSTSDYVKQCLEQQFTILQIEDPEPMDQLDEIAALPGYDMIFFGPGDFAHALGCVGNLADPRVVSARKRVAAAARKHGKFAGTVNGGSDVRALVDEGYQFLNLGADVHALHQYFSKLVEGFAQVTKQ